MNTSQSSIEPESVVDQLELHYLTVAEVKALAADPENPRQHPTDQAAALVSTMTELEALTDDGVQGRGWVAPLTYNRRLGKLQDGHLRQEQIDRLPTNAEGKIPVLFGDWNEQQHRLALLARDPIAAMAATEQAFMTALMSTIQSANEDLQQSLTLIANNEGIHLDPSIFDPSLVTPTDQQSDQPWGGKPAIDPDTIPDYDPSKEVVSVRVNKVPAALAEAVVYLVDMAIKTAGLPKLLKAEVF